MLKYLTNQIVFQEVPDEISMAFWITNCPGVCAGCHSPFLRQDIGQLLTPEVIAQAIKPKEKYVTCVLFMGGDNDIPRLIELVKYCKAELGLKTAVYSGLDLKDVLDTGLTSLSELDFLKIGSWRPACGPLGSANSNQRMWARINHQWVDISHRFS